MSESDAGPDNLLSEYKSPYKCLQTLNGHRLSTFEEFILFCNSQCSASYQFLKPLSRKNRYIYDDVDDFTHHITVSGLSLSNALKHVIRSGSLNDDELLTIGDDISKEINKHIDTAGQLSIGGLIAESNRLLLNLKCQKFDDASQHFSTDFTEDYDYFRELESVLDPSIYLVQMSSPPKHSIYTPGDDFYSTSLSLFHSITPSLVDRLSKQLFTLNYSDFLIGYDELVHNLKDHFELSHTLAEIVFSAFNQKLDSNTLSKLLNVYLSYTFMTNNYTFGLETLIKLMELYENVELNNALFEEFFTFTTLVSMELPIVTSIDDSHKLVAGVPPLGTHLYRIAFKNILFASDRTDGPNSFALWTDASFLSRPIITLSIGTLTMEFLPLKARVVEYNHDHHIVEMPQSERFDIELFIESPKGSGPLYEKRRKIIVFLNGNEILSKNLSVSTNFLEFSISQSIQRLAPMPWTSDDLVKWNHVLSESGFVFSTFASTLDASLVKATNEKVIKGKASKDSPSPLYILDLIHSYIVPLHRLSYNYGLFRTSESLHRILSVIDQLISIDFNFCQSLGMLKHDVELRFNSRTSKMLLKLLNNLADSTQAPVLTLLRSLREPQLYELLAQSPSNDLVNLLHSLSKHDSWADDLQRVIRLSTPKLLATSTNPYEFRSSAWFDLFRKVSSRDSLNHFYISLIKHALLHITATLSSTKLRDQHTRELFLASSTLTSKILDLTVRFSASMASNTTRDLALGLATFYLLVNPTINTTPQDEDVHIFDRLAALLGVWTKLVACSTQASSNFAKFCAQLTLHLCDYIRSINFTQEIPCKLLCNANIIVQGTCDFPFMSLFPQVLRAIRLVSAPPVAAKTSPPLPASIPNSVQIKNPPKPQIKPHQTTGGSFRREIEEVSERLGAAVAPFVSTPELSLLLRRYNIRLLAKVQEIKSEAGSEPPYRYGDLEFTTLSELERHFFSQIGQRCDLIQILFDKNNDENNENSSEAEPKLPNLPLQNKKITRSWRSHSLPCFPESPKTRIKPTNIEPQIAISSENLTSLLDLLVSGPSANSILRSVYGQQLRSLLLYLAVRSTLALQTCEAGKYIPFTLARVVSTSAVQIISLGCTKGLQPLANELIEAIGQCITKLFTSCTKNIKLSNEKTVGNMVLMLERSHIRDFPHSNTPLIIMFSSLLLGPFKDSRMSAPLIKQLFIDANSINSALPLFWLFLVGHDDLHFDVQKAMIWGALQYIKANAANDVNSALETLPHQVSLALMVEFRKIFERVDSLALVRYLFETILATFAIGPRRSHSITTKLGVPFSQLLDVAIRRLHALEPRLPISQDVPIQVHTPTRGRMSSYVCAESPGPMGSSAERGESSVDRVQGEYLFNWLPVLGSIPPELLYSDDGLLYSPCSGGFSMSMPHRFHLEERCATANLISNSYFLSQGPSSSFYPLLMGPSVCVTASGGLGGIVIFPIPSGLEFSTFSQNFEGVQTSTASFTICTDGHFGVTVAPADVVLSSVSELFNRNDAVAFVSSNSERPLDRYATSVSFNQGDVLEANFALHTDTNGQFCLRTELVVAGNSIGSILEVIYDPETQKDPCRRMSLIFIFPTIQALVFDDSNSTRNDNLVSFGRAVLASNTSSNTSSLNATFNSQNVSSNVHSFNSQNSNSPFSFRELESAEFNLGAISSFVDKIQLYQSILMVDFRLLGSLKSILLRRWLDIGINDDLPGWIAVLGCDTAKRGWERVKNLLSIQLASFKLGRDVSKLAPMPALPWLSTSSCVSHSPISRLNPPMLLDIIASLVESEVEWWSSPFLLVILTLVIKRLTPDEVLLGSRDATPELLFDIADKLYNLNSNHIINDKVFNENVVDGKVINDKGFNERAINEKRDPHQQFHGGALLYAEASLADLNIQLMRAIPNYICTKLQSERYIDITRAFMTRDLIKGNDEIWRKFTIYFIELNDRVPDFVRLCKAPLNVLIPFILSLPKPHNKELIISLIPILNDSTIKDLPPEILRLLVESEMSEVSFSVEEIGSLLIDAIGVEVTTNFNLKIPRHYNRLKIASGLHDLASIWIQNAIMNPPNLDNEHIAFKRLALYLSACIRVPHITNVSNEEAIAKSFTPSDDLPLPGYFLDYVLGRGKTCLSGHAWITPLRAAVDYFAQNTTSMGSDSDAEEVVVDSRLLPCDNTLLSELSSDRRSAIVSDYLKANPTLADFVRPEPVNEASYASPISRVADSIRVIRAINACAMSAIPLIAPLFSGPHIYYVSKNERYVPFYSNRDDVLKYLNGKLYLLKQTTNELWSKGFFSAKVQNSDATFSSKPYFSIRVDRTLVDGSLHNSLLSQSAPQILSCDPTMLLSDASQKPFMIVFKGERSTDFGGPFHEFLSSLSAEVALLSEGVTSLMEQCPNLINAQGGYQDTLMFKYTPNKISMSNERTSLSCDALEIDNEIIGTASCWFGCCDLPSCRNLSINNINSNHIINDKVFNERAFNEKGVDGKVFNENSINVQNGVNEYNTFTTGSCNCGGAEAQNSPCSISLPEELRVYEALGRICAMCASMSIPFGVFFNPIVWKKIVFEPLYREDIALFDEATLSHIAMITRGNLLDLRFEVGETSSPNGLANLLPDGHDIAVTYDNVSDYVELLKLYKINQGNIGLTWFAKGFAAVLPLGYIRLMLDSNVVEYMVCGDPEIDIELLREHTHSSNSGLLQKFFTVISEFNNEQLKALLRFVSGRSRLPPAHYNDWKFRIEYEADMPNADARLPTSATCNFRLLVPRYSSLDVFRERLLYASSNCIAIDLDV